MSRSVTFFFARYKCAGATPKYVTGTENTASPHADRLHSTFFF
jgi:hypothetical protein